MWIHIISQNEAGVSIVNLPPKDDNKHFRAKWTYIDEVQFYCSSFLSIQFSKHFCGNREMTDKDEYRN